MQTSEEQCVIFFDIFEFKYPLSYLSVPYSFVEKATVVWKLKPHSVMALTNAIDS